MRRAQRGMAKQPEGAREGDKGPALEREQGVNGKDGASCKKTTRP
jgi:hypothetical protein